MTRLVVKLLIPTVTSKDGMKMMMMMMHILCTTNQLLDLLKTKTDPLELRTWSDCDCVSCLWSASASCGWFGSRGNRSRATTSVKVYGAREEKNKRKVSTVTRPQRH